MMQKIREFNKKDFNVIEHTIAFKGYFSIEKFILRFKLFQGGWSEAVAREIFERGSAVAVIPYDPIEKKLVLIEQFRVGALHDKKTPWLLEPVAGIIDNNETDMDVAVRELKEEAGIVEVKKLIPIYNYWVSPGGCTEQITLFCAHIDIKNVGKFCGLAHENEDIKVHVFTLEEAQDMLKSGILNTSVGIISVQWLLANYK